MTPTPRAGAAPARGNLIDDLLAFLRDPTPDWVPPPERPSNWFGSALWLKLILAFTAVIVVATVKKAIGAERASSIGPSERFLLAVVVAPLIEEAAFRLPLRFGRAQIAVWAGAAAGFTPWLWRLLAQVPALAAVPKEDRLWVRLAMALAVGALVALLLTPERVRVRAEAAHRAAYRWIVWVSILAFGLSHVTNYRFPHPGPATYALAPLLTLPQVFGGCVLAFVRVRYGFWWGVLLHGTFNGVLTLPAGVRRMGKKWLGL